VTTIGTADSAAERSDQLSPVLVEALQGTYDVGDWLAWRRAPEGGANDSFFLTASSGRYVLRLSQLRKSVESLEHEVAVIEHLRAHDYPAPRVIPTRRGAPYAEHDHTFFLLTAFIPGRPWDRVSSQHLTAVGRGLGRFHRLVKSFPGRYESPRSTLLTRLWPDGARALGEVRAVVAGHAGDAAAGRLEEPCAYLESQFRDVHGALRSVAPALSRLTIHGSFGPTALIFEGDALHGVLDYDRASWDFRGVDVAYSLKAFCRAGDGQHAHRVGLDEARCRRFLAAYREEEPFPPDEIPALLLFLRAQWLRNVLSKCENFLAKNAAVPQTTKDVDKIAKLVERHAVRLQWLERNGAALSSALLG
jgi:Ser/Thr protein kinase RdoA (MazF antagonist)